MNRELTVSREHEFSYRICFHEDFSNIVSELSRDGLEFFRACIVTDSQVGPLYAKALADSLETCCKKVSVYTIPAGEEHKTIHTVTGLYEHLILEEFDRKDVLIALGGGVVGDLTGFTAATYLRGIHFIQVPTTLLSQVDSSIGGKTGVDFDSYKNMVGAFHQPVLVYMNLSTLRTLSDEMFACGMGEILKHGLIRDSSYYDWLLANCNEIRGKSPEALEQMIHRSCEIKRDVVEEDPTEQGVRATLNFGHTIGHAVEKLKNFSMPHGQCVAVGCVAAAYLSLQHGGITREDLALIRDGNRMYGLPVHADGLKPEDVLAATKKDKKMSSGTIRFILLASMGRAVIDTTLTDAEILDAVRYITAGV